MTKLFHAMIAMSVFALVIYFTPDARASAIASADNNDGGKMVLTDELCVMWGKTFSDFRQAYSFNSLGLVLPGCFIISLDGSLIKVMWADGDESVYSTKSFTPTSKSKPREKLIPIVGGEIK